MSRARFFLFWGMHGAAEMFLGAVLKDPAPTATAMWLAAALHVSSSYGMLYAIRREPGCTDGWARMLAALSLFLPIAGWMMVSMLIFCYRTKSATPRQPDPDEGIESEDEATSPTPAVPLQLRVRAELDVLPLADILAGPDIELKRGAVEQLAKLATPDAVALLIARRSDPFPETRFFVSTALTRIRSSWDEELNAAKARLRANATDAEARVSLARVYIKSARSGLWDEAAANHLLEQARHHLETAMVDPSVAGLCYADLLALYDASVDYDSAWALVERLAQSGVLNNASGRRWRAEICYRRSDFAGLRRELADLPYVATGDKEGDKDWNTAAAFWSVGCSA